MAENFEPLTIAVPVCVEDEAGLIRGLDFLMQHFGVLWGGEDKGAQALCEAWLSSKYSATGDVP